MKKLLLFSILIVMILSKIAYAQSDLVGYWKFDKGSGSIAYDSSSYGNNGNIYYASWVDGRIVKALSFNGVSSVVKIPRTANLEPASITIDAWVYLESLKQGTIIHKWYSGSGGYSLTLETNNKYSFLIGGSPNTWNTIDTDNTAQINNWTYLAATFNDSTKEMAIYVNGVKKNKTLSGLTIVHADKELEIGAQWSNQGVFNGIIDEVAIYNRALSEEEINEHYNYGLSVGRTISGRLTNKTGFVVQANISVYQIGTNIIVNSTQTDVSGNYMLSVPQGVYDISYKILNLIPNFFIKLLSLSILSSSSNIINYITNINNQSVSFTADIDDNQLIQTYSETKPTRVLINGTPIANASSYSQLTENTWFYDSSEKSLYILTSSSTPTSLCGNNKIDTGEQCELPSTNDNSYCSQSTSSCDTNRKYCTRDGLGNCDSDCQCILDSWSCGSSDDTNYCNNCNHCGDNSLNCGEVCEKGQTQTCTVDNQTGTRPCLSNCNGWGSCSTGGKVYRVDFENTSDFEVGSSAPVWNSPGSEWVLDTYPDQLLFNPTTTIVHNGLQAANLTLSDPSTEGTRRLEIHHNWDPLTTEHVWLEGWYYIPSESIVNEWLAFHRCLYERYWGPNDGRPYYWANLFQVGISFDGRSSRATYGHLIFGVGTGAGDYLGYVRTEDRYPSDQWQYWNTTTDKFEWYLGKENKWMPPIGQWFKIKTYAYRNLSDWDKGIIKVWMAFPPDYTEELIYDERPVRTIGIDPMLIYERQPINAYFTSAFSLYTGIGGSAKSMFFDDITLSNGPDDPNP